MFIKDSVYSQRSVEEAKPSMSCWYPKKFYNKYLGEDVIVPCRECPSCRYSYAIDLQQRINDECKSHEWNFFVTLTYDNKHLPMYIAFPSEDGVYFEAYRDGKVMLDENGIPLPELDFDLNDSWFPEPHHNPYMPGFGFCYKRDIQLFFKRLRIDIARNENKIISEQKIRYFVASEYGPATFRPHYHLIINCDNEELARIMPRLIFENWSMCSPERCDVQLVSGAAPEYVAKYVNSFASLPKVLRTQLTKPFHMASKRPAYGAFKINEEKILDCFVNSAFEVPRLDPKTCEVSFVLFPNKVLSRYFRKYSGYGEGNIDYELRLFEKYEKGNYVKAIDHRTGRYVECQLRGNEYLDDCYSFKYKDYLWYKNVKRLLNTSFSYPHRNDCGFIDYYFKDVKFTLGDIFINMRRMYSDYSLYLLNSAYRSQELTSAAGASPFELLSYYPYLYKDLPLCCSPSRFRLSPDIYPLTYKQIFSRFGLSYDDVYKDNFMRLDFYVNVERSPMVVHAQNDLMSRIQESDYKKKFNDLYNFSDY